jgi:hypothetical protein
VHAPPPDKSANLRRIVIYAKQNHRNNGEFAKLKEDDQQNYWNWRHEHSDALLKIEIK